MTNPQHRLTELCERILAEIHARHLLKPVLDIRYNPANRFTPRFTKDNEASFKITVVYTEWDDFGNHLRKRRFLVATAATPEAAAAHLLALVTEETPLTLDDIIASHHPAIRAKMTKYGDAPAAIPLSRQDVV